MSAELLHECEVVVVFPVNVCNEMFCKDVKLKRIDSIAYSLVWMYHGSIQDDESTTIKDSELTTYPDVKTMMLLFPRQCEYGSTNHDGTSQDRDSK